MSVCGLENLLDERTLGCLAHVDPRLSSQWSDLSLSSGYPGLILFFATMGDEAVVHSYVLKLKSAIERDGVANMSLFSGVSGICFALQRAGFGEGRYGRMLQALHSVLLGSLDEMYLEPMKSRVGLPQFSAHYDPIQGVCGIGRYLVEYLETDGFREAALEIVKVLVQMSRPFVFDGKRVEGWYLPIEDLLNRKLRGTHGVFNLGLAHGLPGILAFLSIALAKGVEVEGQREAIFYIAEWIEKKAFLSDRGVRWPYSVSWQEEVEGQEAIREPARDAWCYGAPGICRSLYLAGSALGDSRLMEFSKSSFSDVFLRSRKEWGLPGPTLCHGIAGLLVVAEAMGEGGDLEQMLLSMHRKESLWGFQDAEPVGSAYRQVDNCGFLEGAVGVWLALLAKDRKWALPMMMDV